MVRAIAAVSDLFFKARLVSVAASGGSEVLFATTPEEVARRAAEAPVDLVVVDLNGTGFDPVGLVRSVRREAATATVRIVGFFSHVQVDLKRSAEAAGATEVLARSRFVEVLPGLLSSPKA